MLEKITQRHPSRRAPKASSQPRYTVWRSAGYKSILMVFVLGIACPAAAQTMSMVVHPEFTADRAQGVYKPLRNYLEETTGFRIKLVTPRDYRVYWRKLKAGEKFDIAIDAPHLAAYRIRRFKYRPLVRAKSPTRFELITDMSVNSPDGLDDSRVVTMPSPSMGYALLTHLYKNPLQQPVVVSEALSWRDAVEIIFSGEAQGAMIPEWLAKRYPQLHSVYRSKVYPGTSITTHPDVSDKVRDTLRETLLHLHEVPTLRQVEVELNVERFEAASRSEYRGLSNLLNYTFGYKKDMVGVPSIKRR